MFQGSGRYPFHPLGLPLFTATPNPALLLRRNEELDVAALLAGEHGDLLAAGKQLAEVAEDEKARGAFMEGSSSLAMASEPTIQVFKRRVQRSPLARPAPAFVDETRRRFARVG